MQPASADLEGLLRALCSHEVAFVIVGGAAAVLHGAPTTTHDLYIVPEQSEANLARLQSFLREQGALVRDLAGRRFEPNPAALRGQGQLQLVTDLGPLDILCRLHDERATELWAVLPRPREPRSHSAQGRGFAALRGLAS